MKPVIQKLLLLLLPLLVVAGVFEARLRLAPGYYNQKSAYFRAARPKISVLVLGSSQANQGIRAGLLDVGAFNLAHVGQDHYYDAALVESLLPLLPALKLVVLPLSYISLEYSFPGTPEDWRTFCYAIHWGIRNETFRYNFDLRNYSLLALTGPFKALRQALGGFKTEATGIQPDGFQAVEPLPGDMLDIFVNDLTAGKRLRYQDSVMRAENRAANLGNLLSLATRLKEHRVALVLVTLPVSRPYREAMDGQKWNRMVKEFKGLAGGFGARYLNYLDDKVFRLGDFYDTDHLDKMGAEKFTLKLKLDLRKAGLL
jgi:hypothetical protein